MREKESVSECVCVCVCVCENKCVIMCKRCIILYVTGARALRLRMPPAWHAELREPDSGHYSHARGQLDSIPASSDVCLHFFSHFFHVDFGILTWQT